MRAALAALALAACSKPAAAPPAPADVTTDAMNDAPPDAATIADSATADAPPTPGLRCRAQWPLATSTAAGHRTERLYARVSLAGVTPSGGRDARLRVEVGVGPRGVAPGGHGWRWETAAYNGACLGCDGEDEYMGAPIAPAAGASSWAARAAYGDGGWTYCERAPEVTVSAPGSLRVLTLNLRCLVDDWPTRRAGLLALLARVDPEVLGLQEACSDGRGGDNVAELVSALEARTGRRYEVFRAVTHRSWDDRYDEGVAVVTPYRIADRAERTLTGGVFPRRVLAARVVGPQGPVVFATTHLDHRDGAARAGQIREALAAVAGFAGAEEAVVVTGDMNEGDGAGVAMALRGAGYTDVWRALRAGEAGATFPGSAPTSRIDQVWLRAGASGFAPGSVEVVPGPSAPVSWGSDHLGVVATVRR